MASLDHLSGGRFLFGIGGGWNAEEMEDHGTDFKTRFRLLREQILAMKEIWTKDEAEYHGEFVNFDKIWSFPKPVQQPHPPILMGGDGPTTFDRVLEYCDGWMPVAGRMGPALVREDRHAAASRQGDRPRPDPGDRLHGEARPRRAGSAGRRPASSARSSPSPRRPPNKVLPLLDSYAKLIR